MSDAEEPTGTVKADDDPTPIRSYMDDPNIKWRTTKPDYSIVNKKFIEERIRRHKAGSLERLAENLVKTWEMESTHKTDKKDWGTIDPDTYGFSTNGGTRHDIQFNIDNGNYNMMLIDCPLFDVTKETNKSSHDLFKTCFPDGFAWELMDILSGPPRVSFTWRHWGTWTGPFGDTPPSGEVMEMFGVCVASVNGDLKITDLQVYFDPNPVLAAMMGHQASKCPFSLSRSS